MKVEHIALYVRDLEGAREFFTSYIGAEAGEAYHNPRTGLKTYFLSFGDGARVEIMSRPEMEDREKGLMRTGYIHLAFSAGSREAVDRLTEELAGAGCEVLSGPRVTGDGYYESCVLGFEDNQIEITV